MGQKRLKIAVQPDKEPPRRWKRCLAILVSIGAVIDLIVMGLILLAALLRWWLI